PAPRSRYRAPAAGRGGKTDEAEGRHQPEEDSRHRPRASRLEPEHGEDLRGVEPGLAMLLEDQDEEGVLGRDQERHERQERRQTEPDQRPQEGWIDLIRMGAS